MLGNVEASKMKTQQECYHEFVYYGFDTLRGETKQCKKCGKLIFEGERWY